MFDHHLCPEPVLTNDFERLVSSCKEPEKKKKDLYIVPVLEDGPRVAPA
jgi:hypothetical protein